MIGYQFLLEIDALNNVGAAVTLRYSCAPAYVGGGHTWTPAIVDPGLLQINLFSGGKTAGASSYSYGEVVLSNAKNLTDLSGPLDALKDYQFYGRPVRMYVGMMNAAFPAGFTIAYTAVIQAINSIGGDRVSFTLRGRQAELDIPYAAPAPANKFLGNNTAPAGLEGESALKDQLKPVIVGRVLNFSPTLCNAQRLIYAVSPFTGLSYQEMGDNLHVYDNGVDLACAGLITEAQMQTLTPPAGQYYVATAGYIKLGSVAAGAVTVSGVCQGYALTSHPAELINMVLTDMGFNAGDSKDMLDSNSFTGFTDKAERGVLATGKNVSAIIDELVSPLGYWYFNQSGKIVFGVMAEPSTLTPVFTANSATNIVKFDCKKTQDTKGGIPASSVTIRHSKNNAVNTNPAGAVSPDQKEWLKTEWRKSSIAADTVQPLAEEMVIDTALTATNSTMLATMKALQTVDREIITIEIIQSEFLTASQLLPGQCIHLNLNGRFGYSAKHMMIVGITINYVQESVNLTLWG